MTRTKVAGVVVDCSDAMSRDKVRLREEALEGVKALLRYIDPNPDRAGLRDTPRRVVDSMLEMTEGSRGNPLAELERVFKCEFKLSPDDVELIGFDGIVVERNISFVSTCEHHLLPFWGLAHVAYIIKPGSKVVGISKLARVVEQYAKRLQMQERLTAQVAHAIDNKLDVIGVMVVMEAEHSCMKCRGIKNHTSSVRTSVCLGVARKDDKARGEIMALMGI